MYSDEEVQLIDEHGVTEEGLIEKLREILDCEEIEGFYSLDELGFRILNAGIILSLPTGESFQLTVQRAHYKNDSKEKEEG